LDALDAGALVPALYRRLILAATTRVRKNVLQLIPSFHQGGSERQAVQLTRLLVDDGRYNIRLACLEKKGVLLDDSIGGRFDDIPEFPLTSFFDANMAKQLRRFVAWVKANKVDIVQTHDFYTNIFGVIGARFANVPVRIAAKRETGMRTDFQRFIERRAFSMTDVVVVNSEGVRKYLSGSGVPVQKLELVHNGIDHERFNGSGGGPAASVTDFGLPKDKPLRFATMVANLREEVKNHEMFLRAARKVADRIKDAAFIVAGEGERMRLITSLARDFGLADRTFFLGRCTLVPELLALSDVCVLTSDSEGFSNSILEYMAAGKPVVATDVGGAAEAIVENETGFLVAPNDDDALADRLCRLFNDRALAEQMGRKGKQRVVEQFSMQQQLDKTLSIYQRELAKAKRG
jgi:glycosyltransferase involved in cell wall biosynthesis